MTSALPEVEAPAAAFAPATPMRARPKSIHSLSLQGTPTQSPFSQQYSPHKPLWPQQAVPIGMTPFPLDPALGGPNIYAFNEDGMPMSVHSSPDGPTNDAADAFRARSY
ncbi:hypothetical protein PHLCEN_2v5836 [Hermanssonia centrifuga]|uniref:Uncharacterized protein n=1 Tax=Hermanssonia centrifuga TaxID=98765 RepID=A0A2R6P111_9APHY|nr:hypothetical protein PHLCEN_2v5836 [Hermanssonia centrifuga]